MGILLRDPQVKGVTSGDWGVWVGAVKGNGVRGVLMKEMGVVSMATWVAREGSVAFPVHLVEVGAAVAVVTVVHHRQYPWRQVCTAHNMLDLQGLQIANSTVRIDWGQCHQGLQVKLSMSIEITWLDGLELDVDMIPHLRCNNWKQYEVHFYCMKVLFLGCSFPFRMYCYDAILVEK